MSLRDVCERDRETGERGWKRKTISAHRNYKRGSAVRHVNTFFSLVTYNII